MQKSIFTLSLCFLIVLFLFLIEAQHTYAQTEIPAGNVSGAWTLANSPYNINGEITIPNDSTLTIEPGVKVVFTGHYKFYVKGRLLAKGTENDTILFTISDTTGFHHLTLPDGGWHGIKILDVASSNDSTIFEYCTFEYGKSNTGTGVVNRSGGAIYTNLDKLRISHCLFRYNKSYSTDTWEGTSGAIIIAGNPIIEYCEFCWNESSWGSVMAVGGNTTGAIIRNNHLHHNTGHGTINVCLDAYPTIINNIIEYNHSYGEPSTPHGHGILHFSNNAGNAKIINNTIVNNTNVGEGGGIFVRDGNPAFINNIVYGNEPSQVNFLWASSVGFFNNLIEGGREGFTGAAFTGAYENCIDAEPLFVSSNDYHLQNTSPCIGAGYYEAGLTPPNDYEGNPRPNPSGSMPDIGAYENPLAIPAHTQIPAGDVSGMWTKANSPYNINGEITIPNDSTLTIEPGVLVEFQGHYKFNVQGRLLAIGTETDTIVFTINDTTGFHNINILDGGWGGIDINSSNDSTLIEYCSFQYGKSNYGGAINCTTDKLRISHCLFRNNLCFSNYAGSAIYISGSPIIEYCEFCRNHAVSGSVFYSYFSCAIVRNNHFHHNSGTSIILMHFPCLKFINNLIEQNYSSNCILDLGLGPIKCSNIGNNEEIISTGIINNTIVNNTCAQWGAIRIKYSPVQYINNIIYGNKPTQVYCSTIYASSVSFYNNLIEGGKEGFGGLPFTGTYENCIDADPKFVGLNDYHLQNTSPCIGAGIDSTLIGSQWYYCPANCFYGSNRPNPAGSMPDIGACEHELGSPVTSVDGETNQLPTKFALEQNYPNPFNPSTIIKYQIPKPVRDDNLNVQLKIYDVLGSEVASLVNQKQKPGTYEVTWDASGFSSGVYFYQLKAGEFIETKKLVLLK